MIVEMEIVRDSSDLDDRFTPYYERGERVEIEWVDGHEDYTGYGSRSNGRKARFYVGKSTGWKPVYIMLIRRDSMGGCAILSDAVRSIRGLCVYERR